jgi:hypothetical protein
MFNPGIPTTLIGAVVAQVMPMTSAVQDKKRQLLRVQSEIRF